MNEKHFELILANESLKEMGVAIADNFVFEGRTYLVLEQDFDMDVKFILTRLQTEEQKTVIANIEDEDEFRRVTDYYQRIVVPGSKGVRPTGRGTH